MTCAVILRFDLWVLFNCICAKSSDLQPLARLKLSHFETSPRKLFFSLSEYYRWPPKKNNCIVSKNFRRTNSIFNFCFRFYPKQKTQYENFFDKICWLHGKQKLNFVIAEIYRKKADISIDFQELESVYTFKTKFFKKTQK